MQLRAVLALVGLAACGESAETSFEIVVADTAAVPTIVGATATTVFWSTGAAIGGAALAALPADARPLATSAGPIAHAGEVVLYVTEGRVWRVGIDGVAERVAPATPDALGGNTRTPPIAAFTTGADVSWGANDAQTVVTLSKTDACDQVWVTDHQIYVAAASASGGRLVRIDQETAVPATMTSSVLWADRFPSGGMAGATYTGRIVAADDDAALWLVEEQPSRRAIVVREPVRGEAEVVLEYMQNASGFFASDTSLYWQEGDTLLSAPRDGGAASIEAELPGTAGAYADGYIYVTNGNAIERLRVE